MDGYAEPGELLAILGGSGAGKSTLLNVLAGRIGPGALTGTISVNGAPRQRSTWRKVAAYVEQQEVLFKNLTVQETFQYAAQLRLPSTLDKKEREARVNDLIAELGLVKCRDTKLFLFLDEPTSGLDAFTAVNIISTVSRIAKARRATTVMTIHQPRTDILEKCDKILILAAGRTVFFGKLESALIFFAKLEYLFLPKPTPLTVNFLDVATLDQRTPELQEQSQARIDLFALEWEKEKALLSLFSGVRVATAEETHQDVADGVRYYSSWGTQFSTLLGRNLKETFRDVGTLGATLGQGLVLCIVIGLLFFRLDRSQAGIQNRLGALFFIVVNQTFGVVMPNLAVLPLQRPIIVRERAAGTYAASAAYVAKFISIIPVTIAGALLLGVPIYWLIGLQASADRYIAFLIIVCVQSFTAMSMGLMIGSGIKNVQLGQIVGPLVIVVFLIFGGNFLNLDSVPIVFRWIQWISLITYSNKALAQNEFKGLIFDCNRPGNCLTNGEDILTNFALNNPDSICFASKTSKPLLRLK
ncbi:ABC-2 type transporter-domain-containing protein [Chytridium lagenaria]|nr:ABC-2 type transporter-domain-containing protein [Chytridium lagenaria]